MGGFEDGDFEFQVVSDDESGFDGFGLAAADDVACGFEGWSIFYRVGAAAAEIGQSPLRHGDERIDLNLGVGEVTQNACQTSPPHSFTLRVK